jgi:hypothetical protein
MFAANMNAPGADELRLTSISSQSVNLIRLVDNENPRSPAAHDPLVRGPALRGLLRLARLYRRVAREQALPDIAETGTQVAKLSWIRDPVTPTTRL